MNQVPVKTRREWFFFFAAMLTLLGCALLQLV